MENEDEEYIEDMKLHIALPAFRKGISKMSKRFDRGIGYSLFIGGKTNVAKRETQLLLKVNSDMEDLLNNPIIFSRIVDYIDEVFGCNVIFNNTKQLREGVIQQYAFLGEDVAEMIADNLVEKVNKRSK